MEQRSHYQCRELLQRAVEAIWPARVSLAVSYADKQMNQQYVISLLLQIFIQLLSMQSGGAVLNSIHSVNNSIQDPGSEEKRIFVDLSKCVNMNQWLRLSEWTKVDGWVGGTELIRN